MARPAARPMAGPGMRPGPMRPMGPRMPRPMARRMMYGNRVMFGVAGSALAWSLLPYQLDQIAAYYNMQAEMLTEAQVIAAMQALNIEQQMLTEEEMAQMDMMDGGMDPGMAMAPAMAFPPQCQ